MGTTSNLSSEEMKRIAPNNPFFEEKDYDDVEFAVRDGRFCMGTSMRPL